MLKTRMWPSGDKEARNGRFRTARNADQIADVKRPSDTFFLYAARAARGLGDGFAAIILPAYLIEIGSNPFEAGPVAAAALLRPSARAPDIMLLAPRYEF